MSKNPSERKTMPGQGEDLDRDVQQGQHKEGKKGMGGSQDWKKEKEHKGSQQGQQGKEPSRQGEPMGQQPKPFDPNKQRQGGGSDKEESDERKRRPA
jgi:hypothetical protein